MPEIVIRWYIDGDEPEDLVKEITDLVPNGPGESDIVTIYDDDGKIYFHSHGGTPEGGKTHPYPQHCLLRDIMGPEHGCTFTPEEIGSDHEQ